MISFEFHLEKWHNKTPKPLWFRGFSNRYLFRFALLVAEEGCGCPVDTFVRSTEAPTEAAAETLNQRSFFVQFICKYNIFFCLDTPLAVPDIALTWSMAHLSTAALRFAPFIRHWRRSQPHPTSTARRAHNPKPKIKIFLS